MLKSDIMTLILNSRLTFSQCCQLDNKGLIKISDTSDFSYKWLKSKLYKMNKSDLLELLNNVRNGR